jgi:DNA repair protein RecO (recombination protein O)
MSDEVHAGLAGAQSSAGDGETSPARRQQVYRTHAVILRRRDQGDADRILTVFTPNYGKLELIGKGICKTTSRNSGHLELFAHSSLQIAKGRTWDIVAEAVMVESFSAMRNDLDKIGAANYIAELVDSFTETGDENLPLWELLLLALRELDTQSTDDDAKRGLLLHWFELQLLALAGFQPQLFTCLACDEDLAPVINFLNLSEGGFYCPDCAAQRRDLEAIEPDTLKVLRFLQTRTWAEVNRFSVRPLLVSRAGNLLYRYLFSVLERQLRSVDFLRRLQAGRAAND